MYIYKNYLVINKNLNLLKINWYLIFLKVIAIKKIKLIFLIFNFVFF